MGGEISYIRSAKRRCRTEWYPYSLRFVRPRLLLVRQGQTLRCCSVESYCWFLSVLLRVWCEGSPVLCFTDWCLIGMLLRFYCWVVLDRPCSSVRSVSPKNRGLDSKTIDYQTKFSLWTFYFPSNPPVTQVTPDMGFYHIFQVGELCFCWHGFVYTLSVPAHCDSFATPPLRPPGDCKWL